RQCAVGGDQGPLAHEDAVTCINHGAGIDVAACADDQVSTAATWVDANERVDQHVVANLNSSAADRVLDMGQGRNPGRGGNDQHSAENRLMKSSNSPAGRGWLNRLTRVKSDPVPALDASR